MQATKHRGRGSGGPSSLPPDVLCFVFSGGRGLVSIPGSRKQSLPCLFIYEYGGGTGTGITESIFNLIRIAENDY